MGRSIKKEKLKDFIGMTAQRYNLQSKNSIDTYRTNNEKTLELINSLSSGLTNNMINKTDESNIISLSNSKDGLIFIDEIEGKTITNYCANGNRKLVLNGPIDTEGIEAYSSETVDYGLVDAELQGNTMHNIWSNSTYSQTVHADLLPKMKIDTGERFVRFEYLEDMPAYWTVMLIGSSKAIDLLKTKTEYTFVFDVECNYEFTTSFSIRQGNSLEVFGTAMSSQKIHNGRNKIKVTTVETPPNVIGEQRLYVQVSEKERTAGRYYKISNVMCFEGDWVNKEVPDEYYDGIKSVGEGTNKLSIYSTKLKPNLISNSGNFKDTIGWRYNGCSTMSVITKDGCKCLTADGSIRHDSINLKHDTNYIYTCEIMFEKDMYVDYGSPLHYWVAKPLEPGFPGCNKMEVIEGNGTAKANTWHRITLNFKTKKYDEYSYPIQITPFIYQNKTLERFYLKEIQLHEGNERQPYKSYMYDDVIDPLIRKREITIKEPLRSLPNGIRDRFVKIFNAWYIERRCKRVVLNGTESWYNATNQNNDTSLYFNTDIIDEYINTTTSRQVALSNNFSWRRIWSSNGSQVMRGFSIEGSASVSRDLRIRINKSELETPNEAGLEKWLSQNNTEIIFALSTPIYEKIEIDPEITCYLDGTHIENDSFIPCNMKIRNTGYNCILKPNTVYTIIADSSKNDYTLNFILDSTSKNADGKYYDIITTPSSLTDQQLRMSSKGNQVQNVRVLEGDQRNAMPSFFLGRKNSFENKRISFKSKTVNLCNNGDQYCNWKADDVEYVKIPNGFILDNKKDGADTRIAKNNSVVLKNGVTYTLSFDVKFLQNSKYNDIQTYWSLFGTKYMDHIFSNGKYKTTFIYKENMPNLGIYFQGVEEDVRLKAEITNIQIEEGSTVTPYTDYDENSFGIDIPASLKSAGEIRDKIIVRDNKLAIERNTGVWTMSDSSSIICGQNENNPDLIYYIINFRDNYVRRAFPSRVECSHFSSIECNSIHYKSVGFENITTYPDNTAEFVGSIHKARFDGEVTPEKIKKWFIDNNVIVVYPLAAPEYEEIPEQMSKIILSNYKNASLFVDNTVPPNIKLRYHADIPINTLLTKSEPAVKMNTEDLNQNVIPYLMDMDYRIVEMQLALENSSSKPVLFKDGLISNVYSMLEKDIRTKIYSKPEYQKRLDAYLKAKKLTEKEYELLRGILDNEYKNSN